MIDREVPQLVINAAKILMEGGSVAEEKGLVCFGV